MFPQAPENNIFVIFQKFADIRKSVKVHHRTNKTTGKFATDVNNTGINGTGGKFATSTIGVVDLILVANLPLVSGTLAAKFAAGVPDTAGK
jgi:hypothetical protein